MESLKKLSFDNIVEENKTDRFFGERLNISVIDNNEVLAESNVRIYTLGDFIKDYFYAELFQPELDYFFLNVFNDEQRALTESMSVNDYVEYLNNNYDELDTGTVNALYQIYNDLNEYISNDNTVRDYKCIHLQSILANEDNTGAGTLIIDYLKDKYELICLYSLEELEGYFLEKVNFKELLNGHLYWTKNQKLNEIL